MTFLEFVRSSRKAIFAALGAGVGSPATLSVAIPPGVDVPWWGYLLFGIINAVITFVVTWGGPANETPKEVK